MPFPNKATQFKPGQSGNPAGFPKGGKHLSTWIQELLNDEDFTVENAGFSGQTYKGAPIKAIIMVAINNSLQGENRWAEWLAKYGYGQKYEIEHTGNIVLHQLSDQELHERIEAYRRRHIIDGTVSGG